MLQGGLSPPPPLGSSLLLPRAWAALLRLLLQQGVAPDALRMLAGPPGANDTELEEAVWARLPLAARKEWVANPHRMTTTEAQAWRPRQTVRWLMTTGLCSSSVEGSSVVSANYFTTQQSFAVSFQQ